jgi:hypothetical protein
MGVPPNEAVAAEASAMGVIEKSELSVSEVSEVEAIQIVGITTLEAKNSSKTSLSERTGV